MKILLTGNHNPYFINTVELREKAIKDLGHELIFFNDRSFLLPGRVRDNNIRLQNWDIKRMNKDLVRIIRRTKPDLCLVIGGHRILSETVKEIKEQGIKTFLWTTDVPSDFLNISKASFFYDHIFCAGTEAITLLKKKGINSVELLPFACDPDIHHPIELTPAERKKYAGDIIFVGSYYPNRLKVLEGISDFDLSVRGPGWGVLPESSSLRHLVVDERVDSDRWIKLYSAAKIIISIHFQDGLIPSEQVSPRVFEAMACKRLVISDRQADVIKVFEEDKHIVCFSDKEELRNKLEFYLKNAPERDRIALGGYNEVLNTHKYVDRINEIVSKLAGDK